MVRIEFNGPGFSKFVDLPDVPRVGEAVQIDAMDYVVKTVVWFIEGDALKHVRVVIRTHRTDGA